jgi:hypothetical protein
MAKKRWADLSAGQRIAVIILGTIQMGLLVSALWDLAHRTSEEVRGDRRMWAGLVFINWVGPLAYFTVGRRECPWCRSCCQPDDDNPSETDSQPSLI